MGRKKNVTCGTLKQFYAIQNLVTMELVINVLQNGGNKTKYYNEEQFETAKKVDLYDYLIRCHANEVTKEGKSLYLNDNKSVYTKSGYSGFVDFATNETGNNITFLMKYLGYGVIEAVLSLCGNGSTLDTVGRVKIKPKMELPERAEDNKRLFAYLCSRGISADTLYKLVGQKLLYQEKEHNNIVFVNHECDWTEIRGSTTYKPYHSMAENSRYDGFWWFCMGDVKAAEQLYICEGSIDAISLYEFQELHGEPTDKTIYASIGGVSKQATIDRIKTLSKKLKVILAVDNDKAGKKCIESNSDLDYILPPMGKDWNEALQELKPCY
ncbi:hypothetical protein P261_00433 [Lachnospiraceae bacterium TWA4]|nr:hypothetical protein P261_00433 [Lachnospiraceae bacterium TWA4]